VFPLVPSRPVDRRFEDAKCLQIVALLTLPQSSPASCLKRQQKELMCRTFKPSDGLEPSTPHYHVTFAGVPEARARFEKIAAALAAADSDHSITFGLAEAGPAEGLQELIARADADFLVARHSPTGNG
jgi:hypothetical protein